MSAGVEINGTNGCRPSGQRQSLSGTVVDTAGNESLGAMCLLRSWESTTTQMDEGTTTDNEEHLKASASVAVPFVADSGVHHPIVADASSNGLACSQSGVRLHCVEIDADANIDVVGNQRSTAIALTVGQFEHHVLRAAGNVEHNPESNSVNNCLELPSEHTVTSKREFCEAPNHALGCHVDSVQVPCVSIADDDERQEMDHPDRIYAMGSNGESADQRQVAAPPVTKSSIHLSSAKRGRARKAEPPEKLGHLACKARLEHYFMGPGRSTLTSSVEDVESYISDEEPQEGSHECTR